MPRGLFGQCARHAGAGWRGRGIARLVEAAAWPTSRDGRFSAPLVDPTSQLGGADRSLGVAPLVDPGGAVVLDRALLPALVGQ